VKPQKRVIFVSVKDWLLGDPEIALPGGGWWLHAFRGDGTLQRPASYSSVALEFIDH